jgi:hypothetical protein
MSDRIPGTVGQEPLGQTDERNGPGQSPGAGFTDLGPVGLDSGSGGSTPGTLTMSGWPRNVSWDEFTELPTRPTGETENAQIHSEVDPPANVAITREGGLLRVTSLDVQVRMVSEDCWVVTGQKTADLLNHEQGHFDITGLLGRDGGNEILAARGKDRNDLQTKVTGIINKYRQRAKNWTESYDTETDHGRKPEPQKRWDDRIRNATQSGKSFSPP